MQNINLKLKKIIQNNPAALASSDFNGRPNISIVACLKVINNKQILITDNYMAQTKKNILKNNRVCLAVWNNKWQGVKIIAQARYYSQGKWQEYVKKMKDNAGMPAKGAILLTPKKIINLK